MREFTNSEDNASTADMSILTILATIDAPAINRDENGEADNLLFIIICAVVTAGSVIKGLVLKVDAPRDCAEERCESTARQVSRVGTWIAT